MQNNTTASNSANDLTGQIRRLQAEAWAEGHRHAWRRDYDGCICYARSHTECGCGLYGTGVLLSLDDNPYGALA